MSPSGDFDGPEPAAWWGISDTGTEPIIIARPAHWSTSFEQFMNILNLLKESIKNNNKSKNQLNATFYLEYFPLGALGDKVVKDLKSMSWSNFLIKRTHLVWMGGGNKTTVGKLHFDRNENLMAMIRGRKTFHLFDPSQVRLFIHHVSI